MESKQKKKEKREQTNHDGIGSNRQPTISNDINGVQTNMLYEISSTLPVCVLRTVKCIKVRDLQLLSPHYRCPPPRARTFSNSVLCVLLLLLFFIP